MNPKALSRPSLSPLASRTLKIVGIIIILAALLDVFVLSMPYKITEQQWQVGFISQAVDRGGISLIGLVLLLVGFWIDSVSEDLPDRKPLWQDLRLYAFLLASLLGLAFLLMFPLYLNSVNGVYHTALTQINQQSTDTQHRLEAERDSKIQQEIGLRRSEITQLLGATNEQLVQLQQAGRLSKEQADLVQKFKADRNSIEPFLQKQETDLSKQLTAEIANGVVKQKQQAEQSLATETLKSGLRIGISSLLLAIGYIAIGWTGLRNLRQM